MPGYPVRTVAVQARSGPAAEPQPRLRRITRVHGHFSGMCCAGHSGTRPSLGFRNRLSTRGFSGNRSNDRGQAGLTDGGRCAHSPDAYQRRQVETLAGYGVPETEIASLIGIDPKTLRRHYRQELDHGHTNPLRRMALLARHLLILIQPMIDGRNERI